MKESKLSKRIYKKGRTNMKTKPHQLNIRLTPQQYKMITEKSHQTNKTKTELIIDSLNKNPIYMIPEFQEILKNIKYLGNQTNQLSQKLDQNQPINKKLIQDLQTGCDELWRLLKSLRQAKPKKV